MAYMANPAAKRNLTREDIERLKTWPKVTFADHSYSHPPGSRRETQQSRGLPGVFGPGLAASRQRFSNFRVLSQVLRLSLRPHERFVSPCLRKTATN
jgi:hypothetical protein